MGHVTVRTRIPRPLLWSRELSDQAMANAPDAVVVIDEAHRIVRFNLAAQELFGRPRVRGPQPATSQCFLDPIVKR